MEVSEIVVQIASLCLSGVILLIRNAILAIEISYSTFPQATLFVLSLVLIYFVYRLLYSMVKMVISLAINMVRTFLLVVCVIFGLCIYLRGWRFITKDIPYIKSLVFLTVSNSSVPGGSKSTLIINSVFKLLNIHPNPELEAISHSILEDLGIKFGNDPVVDAFNPYEDISYEDVHDFVNLKLGSVSDYINEQNIQELGNEFINIWKHSL